MKYSAEEGYIRNSRREMDFRGISSKQVTSRELNYVDF